MNYALYYPTIEFNNYAWLWSASLMWDRIYRIVPNNYTPLDCENVKILCSEGDIGIPINPMSYASKISEEFVKGLEENRWYASALMVDKPDYSNYAKIHKDKVDVAIRDMIISKGGIDNKDWLMIPTNFGALYMTYLANAIAQMNNLSIITDKPEAWTGGTFFKYNAKIEPYPQEWNEHCLAGLVIKDFIPSNIFSIRAEDILDFRRRRRDERQRFFNSIKNASQQIQFCSDPKIINDLIHDLKTDIESKIIDYKKSMDILKVKSFLGLKTITFPVVSKVMQETMSIESTTLKILSTAGGIALGLISGLIDYSKQYSELKDEFEYSYLLELKSNWKNVFQDLDYNWYICRQMEEFIND